jgi:hypothetical protein
VRSEIDRKELPILLAILFFAVWQWLALELSYGDTFSLLSICNTALMECMADVIQPVQVFIHRWLVNAGVNRCTIDLLLRKKD